MLSRVTWISASMTMLLPPLLAVRRHPSAAAAFGPGLAARELDLVAEGTQLVGYPLAVIALDFDAAVVLHRPAGAAVALEHARQLRELLGAARQPGHDGDR